MKSQIYSNWRAVLFGAAIGFAAWSAMAQSTAGIPLPDMDMPYQTVSVHEDANVVRVFFMGTCSYCRQAHAPLIRWGKSLPRTLKFEMTPVASTDPAHMVGAAAYYAVERISPGNTDLFMERVYSAIQDHRQPASDPRTYLAAARAIGIDPRVLNDAMRSKENRDKVFAAARMLARYKVDSTPSMAIGGRYVVGTEVTQGVNSNLFDLLNAVTSKYLIETGRGKG
ncbi:MAG: DsbA family protein [Rhodocyclaceae bacterium]|nr:DsbA family protein [Opitutaceae bacterium]MCL4682651.1 DsbA family protein [Rhodocyclaceae bacterium]